MPCDTSVSFHYLHHRVQVGATSCTPTSAGCGDEKAVPRSTLSFSRRGVFIKHCRGKEYIADINHAVFYNKDEPYQASHPAGVGDETTWFAWDSQLAREAVYLFDPEAAENKDFTFCEQVVPIDSATFQLQFALYEIVRLGGLKSDPLMVEEVSLRILSQVLESSQSVDPKRMQRLAGPTRDQENAVDRVLQMISVRYCEPLTLEEIARETEFTAPYLCRVFKAHTGLPIHRYLNRVRLRHALVELPHRGRNITDLALKSGFCSHAHFTSAFRREFGTTPHRFRLQALKTDGRLWI